MIEIDALKESFLVALEDAFAERVWFVGLQGSYGRGEATESSDIDIVVILDKITAPDIQKYNDMLDSLPYRKLLCGFLSGKDELLSWEPSDLFQFYYDTNPIFGSLDELCPLLDEAALNKAIKTGACNVYHACVHNMLYEKSEDVLRTLYKSASFTVQAIVFKQTGEYVKTQKDLLKVVSKNDKIIIETFLNLKNGGDIDFEIMSVALFEWAKNNITKTGI